MRKFNPQGDFARGVASAFFYAEIGALPNTDPLNPQTSKAWAYAHDVAKAFWRKTNPDKTAVIRHVSEMLAPIEGEWNRVAENAVRGASAASRPPLAQVIGELLDSQFPVIRLNATFGMRHVWKNLGERSHDLLSKSLSDSHPEVRSAAARILGNYPGLGAAGLFSKVLNDPIPYVREDALLSLENYSGPEIGEVIHVSQNNVDPKIRRTAVRRLSRYSGPDLIEFYLTGFSDLDVEVRSEAVRAFNGETKQRIEELRQIMASSTEPEKIKAFQQVLSKLKRVDSRCVTGRLRSLIKIRK
ncbi:MAG: hypothetical protein A2428_09305 [Bdellovibrionales bacterium RIFOXYC1_FULL_54_43]|nr:MAG: hypothetical protein A2428_09305 [Bdellovibrionales bacterium RIFOXYC1_FULL_54_43]OFZ80885.1 MAG: hypothetical protein A2603_08195 [Bdellovibrionales bacterium RIFOXYD1_FULL_55_31]